MTTESPHPLTDSTSRRLYVRVYVVISLLRPNPSRRPRSRISYSLTHTHGSIGYHNIPHPLTDSTSRRLYVRVYVVLSLLRPNPSRRPRSRISYSLTHTHGSIGYHNILQPLTDSASRLTYLSVCVWQERWRFWDHTLPIPPLLTHTCVTTRPATSLTIISTPVTQCMWDV